jgi:hypothetical protein
MNSFTPVFSKIVDSSLWTESDFVCKVFVTLLAIKDSDHIARVNAFGLGRKCWPMDDAGEARAIEALKILESPDTKRIEPQPFDGRRIKKVEDGYLILNGQTYEEMMRSVSRKVYKARKEREYRAKKKLAGDAGEVSAAYRENERRFVEAEKNGDTSKADSIAAEGTLK